ncbi:MAG: DUF342 domain-containing protein [Chitinispirillaceae bacterium]|nr:DUF342 domain-containing protein [Chitinispirillaceae bacterium]
MAANPLSKFVQVEERNDGVYIKISRTEKERVKLEEMINILDQNMVLNYDETRIGEVYSHARGAFEKIGPLFEYYDPEAEQYLQFSITHERVTLSILPSASAAGVLFTEKKLAYFLLRKGVRHGIDLEMLKKIAIEQPYKTTVEVAAATKPVPGEDASLEYLVSISPDARPQIRQDGKVDYREIKSFSSVAAKQVIARKKPFTPGTPGTAINGEPLPAAPGKDLPMPLGRNTEMSSDGTQLIASKAGIVSEENGLINVIELLDIQKDVDFSTGNIKYSGDVMVHGNVLSGFTVEAEGSVHIKGEVESAKIISRNSDVHIDRGIIGRGETQITAKKSIHVAFAQDATLSTEGSITVEKYLLNCDATCFSLQSKDNHGSIIGGVVRAEKFIQVGHLGAEKGNKTQITLFDKERTLLQGKLRELVELDKKLAVEIEPVEKQLKTKSDLLKKFQGAATARQLAEVKKWIDAYNGINTKIKYVHQKMEELKQKIDQTSTRSYDGFVKVAGTVWQGVELELYGRYFNVGDTMTNARFRLNKAEIEYGT